MVAGKREHLSFARKDGLLSWRSPGPAEEAGEKRLTKLRSRADLAFHRV